MTFSTPPNLLQYGRLRRQSRVLVLIIGHYFSIIVSAQQAIIHSSPTRVHCFKVHPGTSIRHNILCFQSQTGSPSIISQYGKKADLPQLSCSNVLALLTVGGVLVVRARRFSCPLQPDSSGSTQSLSSKPFWVKNKHIIRRKIRTSTAPATRSNEGCSVRGGVMISASESNATSYTTRG